MKRFFRLAAPFAALLIISACTGSGIDASGLQPIRAEQAAANPPPPPGSGVTLPGSGQPAATAAPATAAASSAAGPAAAIRTSAKIQFAPVIGATPESVNPLAARLTARATQRGIAVASTADATTTHVLKGYFSAFTEQRETTVIYVWDVLDAAGNRLHRIQGQQKVPAGAQAAGWNSVTPQTMEAIADRTIDDLATWLVSRQG
jgi:hypothetical protein